jgi:FKBP-type peptidyl-prolyl cis-trans isomerase 2
MKNAATGDTVSVHYTGTLDGGEVFDSSKEREPIEFTLGEGKVIPGFENAVEGMSVNETKSVRIPAAEAYGERTEDLVFTFERKNLPGEMEPREGMHVELRGPAGQAVPARIVNVTDESVTVDANHPLSGQDLTFELELVGIADESESESDG